MGSIEEGYKETNNATDAKKHINPRMGVSQVSPIYDTDPR